MDTKESKDLCLNGILWEKGDAEIEHIIPFWYSSGTRRSMTFVFVRNNDNNDEVSERFFSAPMPTVFFFLRNALVSSLR